MNMGQLKKDLIQSAGSSLVSMTQIGKFMGCGKDAVRSLVSGLQYVSVGRKKLYSAADVAEALSEKRRS